MKACELANCIKEDDKCQYCKIVVLTDNRFKFVCNLPNFRFGEDNYNDEDDEEYTLYFDEVCNKENARWCSVIREMNKKKEMDVGIKDSTSSTIESKNTEEISIVDNAEESGRKIHGAIK